MHTVLVADAMVAEFDVAFYKADSLKSNAPQLQVLQRILMY